MQSAPRRSGARAKRQPRPSVRHPEYHDYHAESEEWICHRWNELQQVEGARAVGAAMKKFPMRLHQMLESVDGTSQSTIVRWLPHGRAFLVLDKLKFEKEVLQTHFPSQTGYPSFQRQLSAYGFLRLTRDDDGYYHELFLRGRPALAMLLPSPGRGRFTARMRFDPATEPDFYAMPWLPDLAHSSCRTSVSAKNKLTDDASLPHVQTEELPRCLCRDLPRSSQMPRPPNIKYSALQRQAALLDSALLVNGYATMRSSKDFPSPSPIHNSVARRPPNQHRVPSFPIERLEPYEVAGIFIRQHNSLRSAPPCSHSFMMSTKQHVPPSCAGARIGNQDPRSAETGCTLLIPDEDDLTVRTIAPQSPTSKRLAKLADWADFLYDVNLD